jgi:DNA repair protein RadA/Sms
MKLNVAIGNTDRLTSINDIDVPPQLRRRYPSGIDFFDAALGGIDDVNGFAPSAVAMLTGTPGAGKTTLLLQLADALAGKGYNVLYNTGEESLFQVKMVTERLRLTNSFFVGESIMVGDLLDHADHIRNLDPDKPFFLLQDSLQTLDDGKYANGTNSNTPVRSVEMLTNWAKKTFATVLFIGQVNKDGDFQGKNGILHTIDIRAGLRIDTNKKSETYGQRLLEITKSRYGSGPNAVLGMSREGLYKTGEFWGLAP